MQPVAAGRFLIHPTDTLFFRDARPFNQDDEGMADARSVFPPWPSVLSGAFRAAAARARGWDGHGAWGKDLTAMLGSGPDSTGELTFGPLVLLRELGPGRWQRLYPAPLHLLGKEHDDGCLCLRLLRPGPPLDCDRAEQARLPVLDPPLEGAKELDGRWLTTAGMKAVLDGRVPGMDDCRPAKEIWSLERRVGLQRSSLTRTAASGMLYAATHVRLGRATALGLQVEGLEQGWEPRGLQPLGAFHRTASFRPATAAWEQVSPVLPAADRDGVLRYIVVLLSPTRPLHDGWSRPGGELDPRLPGRVVAACVGRPTMIGGWDVLRQGPRPMAPHLPAGSVFFMEATGAATAWPGSLPRGLGCACARQGFGAYLIGRWPQGSTER